MMMMMKGKVTRKQELIVSSLSQELSKTKSVIDIRRLHYIIDLRRPVSCSKKSAVYGQTERFTTRPHYLLPLVLTPVPSHFSYTENCPRNVGVPNGRARMVTAARRHDNAFRGWIHGRGKPRRGRYIWIIIHVVLARRRVEQTH